MLQGCIFDVLKTLLILTLLTLPTTASLDAHHSCTAGYYVNQQGRCELCPNGTFWTQADQVYHCEKCRVAEAVRNEIVLLPCTATNNTLIGCKVGFFRLKNELQEESCAQCSVCGLGFHLYQDYEVRKCSEHEDAGCCPEPYDVLLAGVCVDKRTLPTTTRLAVLEDQEDTTSSVVDDGQLVEAHFRNVAEYVSNRSSDCMLLSLSIKLSVLLIFIWFYSHYWGKIFLIRK